MWQDTALHNAALNDQAKAVDLLLKLECDLAYNKDGQSAIDYAIMNKFTEVAYVMATHKQRLFLKLALYPNPIISKKTKICNLDSI